MRKWVVAYSARSNGLGNRLRVTLGARNLARARNRNFAVVWPTGPLFQPSFGDLFEGEDWLKLPFTASQMLSGLYGFRDEHLTDVDSDSKKAVWQIRTGGMLELPPDVRDWEEDLRELRPVSEIADSVVRLHTRFGAEPYLGVQVRTHAVSHDKTRLASPIEWFTERLDSIRSGHTDLRFFFSCDVAEVQRQLMDRYPGSVGIMDKGAYNSVPGVRNGIIDLYLLAGASYILGPAHSSFVELAVRLTNHQVPFENSLKKATLDSVALTTVVDPLRPARRN